MSVDRSPCLMSLCAIVLVLAGCARRAEPTRAAAPVIDLMPAFWEFEAQARDLPQPEQASLFVRRLVERFPQVYTRGVLGFDESRPMAEQTSERYAKWAPLVAPHLPLMRRLSAQIGADLPRYQQSFAEAFPDYRQSAEVYFLCSLGGFDGATRSVKGKTALLFGVDMIAFIYGEKADPQPFFHHELFHLHHEALVPTPAGAPLYFALWREGLAELVAKELNPSADGVALFGLPEDMPARAEENLPELARAFRAQLDSTSNGDYARYFLGRDGRPGRSGYYLGFRVAQRLAPGRTLGELARLSGPALRSEIDAALAALGAP